MPPWRSSTSCHWLRQTKSLDQCLWPFCLKYDCNVLSSALQISCPSANIPQLSNRTTRRQIHKTIPLMFVVGSQDLSGCKHLTLCGTALHKPHANQTKKNNTPDLISYTPFCFTTSWSILMWVDITRSSVGTVFLLMCAQSMCGIWFHRDMTNVSHDLLLKEQTLTHELALNICCPGAKFSSTQTKMSRSNIVILGIFVVNQSSAST